MNDYGEKFMNQQTYNSKQKAQMNAARGYSVSNISTLIFHPFLNSFFKSKCSMRVLRPIAILLVTALTVESLAFAAGTAGANTPAPDGPGIAIPEKFGSIQESSFKKDAPVIVHIQDAHESLGAQESIAGILDEMASHYDIHFVGLEGADGVVDTSLLSTFPDADVKKQVGRRLLESGRISAGEYHAVITEQLTNIQGVENQALYQQNLEKFRTVMDLRESFEGPWDVFYGDLKMLEHRMYSERLMRFVEEQLKFSRHKVKMSDYLLHLLSFFPEDRRNIIPDYPNLAVFIRAASLEKEINFSDAAFEREKMIQKLEKVLSRDQKDLLIIQSFKYSRNEIKSSDFHTYLKSLFKVSGFSDAEFRNILLYADYVTGLESVDLNGILNEIQEYEREIKVRLYSDPEQKAFAEWMELTRLLIKSVRLKSAREEVDLLEQLMNKEGIQSYTDYFGVLQQDFRFQSEGLSAIPAVLKTLPEAFDFYRIAKLRDHHLISNTVQEMKRLGLTRAALVTGGFHAEGIANEMNGMQISYLTIVPKLGDDGATRPYVTILTKKPAVYEDTYRSSDSYLLPPAFFMQTNFSHDEILRFVAQLAIQYRMIHSRVPDAEFIGRYVEAYRAELNRRGLNGWISPDELSRILLSMRDLRMKRAGEYGIEIDGENLIVSSADMSVRTAGNASVLLPESEHQSTEAKNPDPDVIAVRYAAEAGRAAERDSRQTAHEWAANPLHLAPLLRKMGRQSDLSEGEFGIILAQTLEILGEPAAAETDSVSTSAQTAATVTGTVEMPSDEEVQDTEKPADAEAVAAPAAAVSKSIKPRSVDWVGWTRYVPEMIGLGLAVFAMPAAAGIWAWMLVVWVPRLIMVLTGFVHGFGHAAHDFILTGKLNAFEWSRISENRSFQQLGLLPFQPIPQFTLNAPKLEVGHTGMRAGFYAAGGVLFNLLTAFLMGVSMRSGWIPDENLYHSWAGVFIGFSLFSAFSFFDFLTMFTGSGLVTCGPGFVISSRDRSVPDEQLLSDETMEDISTMNEEARQRGSQAGGVALLARDKNGKYAILFTKKVNGKRSNLVEVLDLETRKLMQKKSAEGYQPLVEIDVAAMHLRFTTVGETDWNNTQPHWYEGPLETEVMSVQNGLIKIEKKPVFNMITHNGDADYFKVRTRYRGSMTELVLPMRMARKFYTRVMPQSTSKGDSDSRSIAEWTDYNLTQGMAYKSLRYAYFSTTADIEKVFGGKDPLEDLIDESDVYSEVSLGVLEGWAQRIEDNIRLEVQKPGNSFFGMGASSLTDISDEGRIRIKEIALKIFKSDHRLKNKSASEVDLLAEEFTQAYLYHDLTWLMQQAPDGLRGDFALTVLTTTEPRMGIFALSQSYSLGDNRTDGKRYGNAQPEAVTSALSNSDPNGDVFQMFVPDKHFGIIDFKRRSGESGIRIYPPDGPLDADGRPVPLDESELGWFPVRNNPLLELQTKRIAEKDRLEKDIRDTPFILNHVQESFVPQQEGRVSGGENVATMEHFSELWNQIMSEWIDKDDWLMEKAETDGRHHTSMQSGPYDLLLFGEDFNQEFLQEFARRLKDRFPYANIGVMSSNEVLELTKQSARETERTHLHFDEHTIVMGSSNSAQTRPTRDVFNRIQDFVPKDRIFVITQKRFNAISQSLGQGYQLGDPIVPNTFLNLSHHTPEGDIVSRGNEATPITRVATHAVLLEILTALTDEAIKLRDSVNRAPFKMPEDYKESDIEKEREYRTREYDVNVPNRIGYDASGKKLENPLDTENILNEAKRRAENVLEWVKAYGIFFIGYVAIIATIFQSPIFYSFTTSLLGSTGLLTPLGGVALTLALVLDAVFFLTGGWLTTLAVRWWENRPIMERMNPRIELYVDKQFIARTLERQNATLFANAPGFLSVIVYSADLVVDALNRFQMRANRGVTVILRVAEERFGISASNFYASSKVVINQVVGIKFNLGKPQVRTSARKDSADAAALTAPLKARDPKPLILSDGFKDLVERDKYGNIGNTALRQLDSVSDFDTLITELLIAHYRAQIVSRFIGNIVSTIPVIGPFIVRKFNLEYLWVPGTTANGALIFSTRAPTAHTDAVNPRMISREEAMIEAARKTERLEKAIEEEHVPTAESLIVELEVNRFADQQRIAVLRQRLTRLQLIQQNPQYFSAIAQAEADADALDTFARIQNLIRTGEIETAKAEKETFEKHPGVKPGQITALEAQLKDINNQYVFASQLETAGGLLEEGDIAGAEAIVYKLLELSSSPLYSDALKLLNSVHTAASAAKFNEFEEEVIRLIDEGKRELAAEVLDQKEKQSYLTPAQQSRIAILRSRNEFGQGIFDDDEPLTEPVLTAIEDISPQTDEAVLSEVESDSDADRAPPVRVKRSRLKPFLLILFVLFVSLIPIHELNLKGTFKKDTAAKPVPVEVNPDPEEVTVPPVLKAGESDEDKPKALLPAEKTDNGNVTPRGLKPLPVQPDPDLEKARLQAEVLISQIEKASADVRQDTGRVESLSGQVRQLSEKQKLAEAQFESAGHASEKAKTQLISDSRVFDTDFYENGFIRTGNADDGYQYFGRESVKELIFKDGRFYLADEATGELTEAELSEQAITLAAASQAEKLRLAQTEADRKSEALLAESFPEPAVQANSKRIETARSYLREKPAASGYLADLNNLGVIHSVNDSWIVKQYTAPHQTVYFPVTAEYLDHIKPLNQLDDETLQRSGVRQSAKGYWVPIDGSTESLLVDGNELVAVLTDTATGKLRVYRALVSENAFTVIQKRIADEVIEDVPQISDDQAEKFAGSVRERAGTAKRKIRQSRQNAQKAADDLAVAEQNLQSENRKLKEAELRLATARAKLNADEAELKRLKGELEKLRDEHPELAEDESTQTDDAQDELSDNSFAVGLLVSGSDELTETVAPQVIRLLSSRNIRVIQTSLKDKNRQTAVDELRASGAGVIVDESALEDLDVIPALLQKIDQAQQITLEPLRNLVLNMISSEPLSAMSEFRKNELLRFIEQLLPDPRQRDLYLISWAQGFLVPETQAVNPASGDVLTGNLAEFDAAVSDVLLAEDETTRLAAEEEAREVFEQSVASVAGADDAEAAFDRFLERLNTQNRARYAVIDPSYRFDGSGTGKKETALIIDETSEPKTIITDLDVFSRDGSGKPYRYRMERYDRKYPGAFRNVLLVRDPSIGNIEQLLEKYPEAVYYGSNVIFAHNAANPDDVVQARGNIVLNKQTAILMNQPEDLSGEAELHKDAFDMLSVMSLSRNSQTTIRFLETAMEFLSNPAHLPKYVSLFGGLYVFEWPFPAPQDYLDQQAIDARSSDISA